MRNLRLVARIIGHLLYFEALMMLVCLGISLYFGDDDVAAFMLSIVVTVIAALTICYFSRDAKNILNRRDSYLVVSCAWVMFSLFGTLPYIISGYIPSFSDAFFEAMSNFTTTGLSTFNVAMPHGLIFWRSLAQWAGGLGIVFFTIAILPSFVDGDVKIFAAETTGAMRNRLHPRIRTNARWIWATYLVLTLACVAALMLCGMDTFDSINYSMVTTATGGHTPYGDSVAHFHSPAIEYVETIFMLLSGISFVTLYSFAFKRKFRMALSNTELRFYLGTVMACTLVIFFVLVIGNDYDLEHAFRAALFEVVSILSSTGMYADNLSVWPPFAWFILGACMIMGACAGSTSGGIKTIRVVMLLKNARNEFKHILHPNAILPVRVNGNPVGHSMQSTLMAFVTLYMIIVVLASVAFMAMGMDMRTASTVTISCISTCGPAFGPQIDAAIAWDNIPVVGKWLCSSLMLVGRLEIFSVLILFTKSFWKDN